MAYDSGGSGILFTYWKSRRLEISGFQDQSFGQLIFGPTKQALQPQAEALNLPVFVSKGYRVPWRRTGPNTNSHRRKGPLWLEESSCWTGRGASSVWLGKGLARAACTLAAVVLRGLGALSAELGVGPELVLCLRFFLLSFPPCLSSRVLFLCAVFLLRGFPKIFTNFHPHMSNRRLFNGAYAALETRQRDSSRPPTPPRLYHFPSSLIPS